MDVFMAVERRKPRKGVYLLPNMITTLSMFLGFLSMVWSGQGRFEAACFAILLSAWLSCSAPSWTVWTGKSPV